MLENIGASPALKGFIVLGFHLIWGPIAKGFHEPSGVIPVDPVQGGDLDCVE